jgi:hypothetical protein
MVEANQIRHKEPDDAALDEIADPHFREIVSRRWQGAWLDLGSGPGATCVLHSAYKVACLPSAPGFQHAWTSRL